MWYEIFAMQTIAIFSLNLEEISLSCSKISATDADGIPTVLYFS